MQPLKTVPQGLKPFLFRFALPGTAKAVPFQTISSRFLKCDCPGKLIPRLDALRRKHNTGAYDDYGLVAQGEADLAGEVRVAVEGWISPTRWRECGGVRC